jgi:hypothetical protein
MLNLNGVGRPLCRIDGGKYANHVVSVSDQFRQPGEEERETEDAGLIKEFRQLKIANDAKFQQVPNPKTEREILYITGRSGSGKSTYTRKYLEEYKKKFKHREIYMFSALPDDPSLDSINPKRIELDESIVSDPIKAEDLKDAVAIFDDIDVISDRKIREEVYKLLNQVLEIGRHFNITCIVTNHLPTNGKDTRRILNEAHSFTYFPHAATGRIKYFLTEYLGLDKKTIAYMKRQNTRWCTIFKNYPGEYMLEREIGLLGIFDEDV